MNGVKFIGMVFLIVCNSGNLQATQLWKRDVMICSQNSKCKLNTITWTTSQPYTTKEGNSIQFTSHYCTSPNSWLPIIKSLLRKDGRHNTILLSKIISRECFETSFPKKVVLLETILNGKGWEIKRAQWLYSEPENIYQAFIE